jgi:hypothetical protein
VRIELGEVEAALAAAPGVSQAVAAAVAAAGGDSGSPKRLVGYVVPGSVDVAGVLAHCQGTLLPTMVPSAVVALDAFPLLPGSGKVSCNQSARCLQSMSTNISVATQRISSLVTTVANIWS